jgi:hypothetical protein
MSDRVNWKAFVVVWAIACIFLLTLASGVFGAPAPFTCEQVQAFVHGKTEAQLKGVLDGMSASERAAARQCLQKPKAKPHSVQPVQPVQPAVVPIAQPAPVVVQPVQPVQPVAVSPPPKPKKGSLMKLIEIILVAGGGIVAFLVMKYGVVAVVQKVLSWWSARKLVPTTQMLLDAHAAFEARLTELEDRFKPATAPETKPDTVTINEAAHGQEVAEPAKV